MSKKLLLRNLPIIIALIVLLLTIPLLLLAVTQKQDIRKEAAEPDQFPKVDLNNDGVINAVDFKIYQEQYAKSPQPLK
ncbi:MAG: hypothetical protein M1575_03455 [Patescibacteria group bacterium]|nr:hypothetical protein [Patescibacteria group bacterium]MCL5095755.1 hypothetical protein [Patescibacteria group bacterium]